MIAQDFLRERDKKLLDLLYRFKVASIEDIRAIIFEEIGKNHVYARLKELVAMGFVQKITYQKNGKYLAVYSLSKRSFRQLMDNQECNSEGRKQFLSDKVDHDLSLLKIYQRFIKCPRIAGFLTENVLASGDSEVRSYGIEEWIKNNPDAILIDETPKGRYFLPLECELSMKKGFRYETKLTHYYQSDKIPAVLYVCANAKIRDSLCRIDEKYCHAYRPKVFYGLMEQFANDCAKLTFTNRKGGKLKF